MLPLTLAIINEDEADHLRTIDRDTARFVQISAARAALKWGRLWLYERGIDDS